MIFTRASLFRNPNFHLRVSSVDGPSSIPIPAPGQCGEPILVSREGIQHSPISDALTIHLLRARNAISDATTRATDVQQSTVGQ
ncbi:hypothetical protein J7T55_007311 [Diaporthe amygdali]|uniref:uncharacterized protein n=1 Tax=Phomopsis amygdali TaxID=1214568 RepID=UPI0022FF23DB|nr:uncharacterized protein J7T55_007311 [Diaporthe amygdali]KAJ0116332.1 hypothetical protein J7T55_007311 [Diaporthe amygdali]